MNVGIIGLGLIGGSLAKAFKANTDFRVWGFDADRDVVNAALDAGAIDGSLSEAALESCGLVVVALYPADTVRFVAENAPRFQKGAVVMDCCGVKRPVCGALRQISRENGFHFLGGHPMAGTEKSGFSNSYPGLFKNASLILTPYPETPAGCVDAIRDTALRLGFGKLQITDPETHDRMIAYTSQLAHAVSCAYVDSPLAQNFDGFSAGSFMDMTRVARLNETMWSELFLDNADCLCAEIEALAGRLNELSAAIKSGDRAALSALLRRAREAKEAIDTRREVPA